MNIEKTRNWIYQNARPLDLFRWQYYFEGGSKDNVLNALLRYQNNDGGFAYALEPDYWNPNSSPIQTWVATEIIKDLNITHANNEIVKGILKYLDSGRDFENNKWLCKVKSNNDYPHAPWWAYKEDDNSNLEYNPTACLAGFALYFADRSSKLYKKAEFIANEAIDQYLSGDLLDDMHEVKCYIRLMEYIEGAGLSNDFKLAEFKEKLILQVDTTIEKDEEKWLNDYICKPSQYFNNPESVFYANTKTFVDFELNKIITSQTEEGIWLIPWKWSEYEREFSISENWWKADMAIKNMLMLSNFKSSIIKVNNI